MAKSAHTEPKTQNRHSRRLAGVSTRTIDQKEQDLAIISRMLFNGRTHNEIAEALCTAHSDPLWISRSGVSRDADLLLRRWRDLSTNDIADAKGRELARLDEVERRAWERIEALTTEGSKKTSIFNVRKLSGDKTKKLAAGTGGKRETVHNSDGIGHWLQMIRWASEQRSKILGLYAPLRIDAGEGGLIGAAGASLSMVQMNINVGSTKTLDELRTASVVDMPEDEEEIADPDA